MSFVVSDIVYSVCFFRSKDCIKLINLDQGLSCYAHVWMTMTSPPPIFVSKSIALHHVDISNIPEIISEIFAFRSLQVSISIVSILTPCPSSSRQTQKSS